MTTRTPDPSSLRSLQSNKAQWRQKTNVVRLYPSARSARKLRSPARAVHSQKIISADLLAFPPGGRDHIGPMGRGDTPALLPFASAPMTDTDIGSHLGNRVPAVEQFLDRLHEGLIAGDNSSRQAGAIPPTTERRVLRTIGGMGRNVTPVQFRRDLAKRLKAARIAAGRENLKEFAKDLGVEWERYKKWESGRTPIPHEFIPRACDLLGKDANYLFAIAAHEQQQALPRVSTGTR